jgi:hypothetical protein
LLRCSNSVEYLALRRCKLAGDYLSALIPAILALPRLSCLEIEGNPGFGNSVNIKALMTCLAEKSAKIAGALADWDAKAQLALSPGVQSERSASLDDHHIPRDRPMPLHLSHLKLWRNNLDWRGTCTIDSSLLSASQANFDPLFFFFFWQLLLIFATSFGRLLAIFSHSTSVVTILAQEAASLSQKPSATTPAWYTLTSAATASARKESELLVSCTFPPFLFFLWCDELK